MWQVPAAVVFASLSVALFGLTPRLQVLAWALFALAVVVTLMGPTLQLTDSQMRLSPFGAVGTAPVGPVDAGGWSPCSWPPACWWLPDWRSSGDVTCPGPAPGPAPDLTHWPEGREPRRILHQEELMSDEFDRSRFEAALGVVDDWPVDNVSAAVVGPEGALAVRGDRDRVYRLASVTKPIVAVAALLAIEEEAISLDEPAGPEGSTVRHLLAHASGLDFGDRDKVRTGPGERRIYSSAGFEVLADHITEATGIAFTDYLDEAVCRPLGMGSTVLEGSPGHGASGSLADLIAFAGELVAPRLLAAETLDEATAEQFGGINGVVPGYGMQKPCPWGLGFELRGAKHPHWTGQHNSPGTFGHFGQSGTLLWVEPEISTALIVLTDRDFGDWAKPLWPELSDRVVDAGTRRSNPDDSLGG